MWSYYKNRIIGGVLGITVMSVWGLMTLWHDGDLAKNYIRTEGRANRIKSHCVVVESGWFAGPDRDIDCRDAEATKRSFSKSRRYRVKAESVVDFEFVSPRDQGRYAGTVVIKDALYLVPETGDSITVFVHKSKPATFQYGGRWRDAK
ncbi:MULTISPECIES: hypothetical protein [Asticcacaulis]|uniref:hypothetical protein n=1 Tax=Asticcacaulis TaxID=76890 RepID=UPI001AEA23E6|nr:MULTISPECIES: hypothetical protein [Asticcacaulis]MBP2160747.1 hypothetical protein [Asticcacaulis solisilvae]MDR6801792.1 hypothetical protein [Asticcacaulis sp. BE141]